MDNKCVCCNIIYEKGECDYYNLCNECFSHFDFQKIRGRVIKTIYKQIPKFYTESVAEFVESKRCPHSNEIS